MRQIDSNQYILRYKISKAENASLEEQIRILKIIKKKNLQSVGLMNLQNCIIRMVKQKNVWSSVMILSFGLMKDVMF